MAGILEQFATADIAPPAQPEPAGGILGQFATSDSEERAPQESRVAENVGQDFTAGLSSGTDQLQATMFALSRMVGREMGIEGLEDASQEGLDRNLAESQEFLPSVQGFSDVESTSDFFRWASGALGQMAPSMGLAMASGGIGGAIGKKAVESSIRSTVRSRMVRNMVDKGISQEAAERAAAKALASKAGFTMLRDGMTRGAENAVVAGRGFTRGAQIGVFAGSAGPQIGEADLSLGEAGVESGFSSILAGVAGGLLEIAPAVRLLNKVFPGVDKVASANFVSDFAKFAGVQGVLEGSTEGMQEVIQLAALAYHDPNFDMLDPENVTQVTDAFAAGALMGVVTGGLGSVGGALANRTPTVADQTPPPTIPEYDIGRTDEALPEGFEPAANTVFQEVRNRVDNVMQETINPALNVVQASFQQGVGAMSAVVPALNATLGKIGAGAKQAHDEFIDGHQAIIDDSKRYAKEQIDYITERAHAITDPAARQKFIEESVAEVSAQVASVAEQLRNRGQRVADSVTAQVDGISVFDDEFTNPEVESDTEFTFGKQVNKQATRGEQAQPLKSRNSARTLVERLRKRFPSATDSTFGIREVDGGFVVALEDSGQREALIEDEIISQGVDNARESGRTSPDKNRQAEVQMQGVGGKTRIDVPTLIFAGRKLDSGDNQTIQQGFLAMAGRLLDRGIIGDDGFAALNETFNRLYPDQAEKEASIREAQSRTTKNSDFDPDDITQEVDPEGELNRDTVKNARAQLDEEAADIRERTPPVSKGKPKRKTVEGETVSQKIKREADAIPDSEKAKRAKPKKPKKAKPKKAKPKRRAKPTQAKNEKNLNSGASVQVYLPGDPNIPGDKGVSGVARVAINSLAQRVAKLLSPNLKLRIINTNAAMRMIQNDHAHASIAEELLDTHSRFAVKYTDGPVYILVDNFEDAGASITALIHELGHVLHYDTWAQLSLAEQDKLWEAFVADVNSGFRTSGKNIRFDPDGKPPPGTPAEVNIFEFKEWMADQFVDWMTNRTKPTNAIERFMETVAQKMDQVWEFIVQNPGRFNQLNHTYADFVDAVALRVARGDPTGNGRWFNNEGEMGRSVESIFSGAEDIVPKGLTETEWTALKKRIEEQYPVIAKRAATITDWLHKAYYAALAPSTSVMRNLSGRGIKSADKLVQIFNRREHGKAKLTRNYHQRIKIMSRQFMNRRDKITEGMSEADKVALLQRMREMDGNPDVQPRTLKERQMRKLFDDMHDYLKSSGLPVGKIPNYFPRMFNREALVNNQDKIMKWYMSQYSEQQQAEAALSGNDEAKAWFNSLISNEADAAAAQREVQADELSMQSPSFRNMRSRTARSKFMRQFEETNLDAVVSNYINSATKRGEYNRALGSKAPKGVIGGDRLSRKVWNPQGQLDSILDDARKEGATDEDLKKMKNYVEANLGQYGRDDVAKLLGKFGVSDPEAASTKVRVAMASVIAYQNMRVLLFTVFASLPDLVGPAIRSGDMRGSFKTFMNNVKQVANSDSDLSEMARAWGVVTNAANQHVLTEYVDNHYMPPKIRKWNDAFFKYTGLNWYTDFTRKMALAVGIDSIKQQAAKVNDKSLTQKERDRAKQFLAELGLNDDMVNVWVENGERTWGGIGYDTDSAVDQQVAEALVQFVDESIMSPNASQRPILASHPAAMLVFHLKGFIYAMHDTILKRLAHNFRIADTPAQVVAAIAPAIMMLMLTALGLELRELVTGNRRTDGMDGWDYTWTTVERSGLLGISQLGFDFEGAGARGQAELAALSGPAVGQLGDLISKPFSQTIPKAIPVVSQLPWARNALREATPL